MWGGSMVPWSPPWRKPRHTHSGCTELSAVLRMLVHSSHITTQLPLKTDHLSTHLIFTWSLRLSTLSFTWLLGHHLLFGKNTVFSQNEEQGSTQITQGFKHNWGMTHDWQSSSTSTELWSVCRGVKHSCFWNCLWYLFVDHTWSKLHAVIPWIRPAYGTPSKE
jgi:hypothetical protein